MDTPRASLLQAARTRKHFVTSSDRTITMVTHAHPRRLSRRKPAASCETHASRTRTIRNMHARKLKPKQARERCPALRVRCEHMDAHYRPNRQKLKKIDAPTHSRLLSVYDLCQREVAWARPVSHRTPRSHQVAGLMRSNGKLWSKPVLVAYNSSARHRRGQNLRKGHSSCMD